MAQSLLEEAETHLRMRKLASALALFDAAEAIGADADRCSAGRWLASMLRGDFEAAWRESDAIRERGKPDPHRFWQGEDLCGRRVILRCLHGFGDAVQFMRYLRPLRLRAAGVVVEVPPALLELAPMFDGVEQAITWADKAPETLPSWDVQVEINELPYLFRTQPAELPVATRYLKPNAELLRASAPQPRDEASLRVGVVWASGTWNPARSVPFELFRQVFDTPGCEFWNLQGGSSRGDWHILPQNSAMHEANACADSIASLAGLIAQLDLVITTDTLAAHLAGALDTPALLMLEHTADWRWQHDRADSPWYSSLQIVRQPQPGQWSAVVAAIQQALSLRTLQHSRRSLVSA